MHPSLQCQHVVVVVVVVIVMMMIGCLALFARRLW
jgi:hypothetical protein